MAKEMRKSLYVKKEAEASKAKIDKEVERLKNLEELAKKAQEEEMNVVNETRKEIDKLCADKNLKCELRFTVKDVLTLVEMFATTQMPSITISYGLYFDDSETKEDDNTN